MAKVGRKRIGKEIARELTITLPGEDKRKVEALAKRLRVPTSQVVRWAIYEYLERHPDGAGPQQS